VYSLRQGGFVRKVLAWARQNPNLRIVSDQVGSPTGARSLAEVSAQVLAMSLPTPADWLSERRGLYHLGGRGSVSRLGWAQKILELDPEPAEQVVQEIGEAFTREFPTPAARPLHSPLDCTLFADTFGICLPDWDESLRLTMEGL
jgi:dTDP-4-dehydrorhamnose reductase